MEASPHAIKIFPKSNGKKQDARLTLEEQVKDSVMPMNSTPVELLFLLGVAVVIAFFIAGEMLELKPLRRPVRVRGQASAAGFRMPDDRVVR
jgi:hypothetical protein